MIPELKHCNAGQIKGLVFVESKYNYLPKFIAAAKEGNQKYIDSLIRRGKVTYCTNGR